jgi:hypothetical protein
MIPGQPFVDFVCQPLGLKKKDSRLRHDELAVWKTDDSTAPG